MPLPELKIKIKGRLPPVKTHCVLSGAGNWTFEAIQTLPYRLDPQFIKDWGESPWWRGKCTNYDHVNYRWVDSNCPNLDLTTLDFQKQFCERFNGKKFLFVGDSVFGQFFASISHLLGFYHSHQNWENPCNARGKDKCHTFDIEVEFCSHFNTSVYGHFIRNEHLLYKNEFDLQKIRHASGNPWYRVFCDFRTTIHKYDFFIMNRGAHFTETSIFKTQLNDTMFHLAKEFNLKNVIYVGTQLVPKNRQKDKIPYEVLPEQSTSYSHNHFEEQNLIAKFLMEKYGAKFLNISHMTLKRPDGFTDSMHMCQPGVIDYYSYLLFHKMLE